MEREILVQDAYLEEFVFGTYGESLQLSFEPMDDDKPKMKLECLNPFFVKYQTWLGSGLPFVSMVIRETLPIDQAEERLKPLGYSEFQVVVDSGKHSVEHVHILHLNTIDLDMVIACTEVRMELSG